MLDGRRSMKLFRSNTVMFNFYKYLRRTSGTVEIVPENLASEAMHGFVCNLFAPQSAVLSLELLLYLMYRWLF